MDDNYHEDVHLAPQHRSKWPTPTRKRPTMRTMERWVYDGIAKATDGCKVEPDGTCPHGHPSWLLRLGYI